MFVTRREISVFVGAALMFAVAAWFWLNDLDARQNGVPLVGTYSGSFERQKINSKFGGHRSSARLVIDFVAPDGTARSAQLTDLTDLDKLPAAGTQIDIVWLPRTPDRVRSAEALRGPVGQSALWAGGIAAVIFFAQLADHLGRRKRGA